MSWNFYWSAGGHAAQPLYNQFDYGGCAVGCGPVAWTMLFCWGDHQAGTGNAYWAPRWGLYRQDGGYGADVVAPLTMDEGVKNVVREIHNDIGTFCIFGSGATFPWSMPDAWHYLSGRTGTTLEAHWDSLGISEDGLARVKSFCASLRHLFGDPRYRQGCRPAHSTDPSIAF